MGLFGLIIPEEHGGLGLSNAAVCARAVADQRHDSSVSLTIGAHSSIGMKGLLLFGTPSRRRATAAPGQRRDDRGVLSDRGRRRVDAASVRTKAVRNDDGSWTLSGEKIWITNGGIADFYTVFARTDTPDGKMTAFLVVNRPGPA